MVRGAGDRSRTGDLNLGKVALYQLSYARLDLIMQEKPEIGKGEPLKMRECRLMLVPVASVPPKHPVVLVLAPLHAQTPVPPLRQANCN